MQHRFLIFLILFFAAKPLVQAQVKNVGLPRIINYKKADYSGGSQNWDIGQDKAGNLYFANTAGLIQFNGTSWTKYPIPNATVRSLKVSENGRIYVGGYNEFGYFEAGGKGKLEYHSLSKLLPPNTGKIVDFVWKTHIIGDAVFFQTFFCTYIYRNGKLTMLDPPSRFNFSFEVNGTLYLQDISKGIVVLTGHGLQPLKDTEALNATEVWGLLPFQDGLMVITNNKGIFLYRNGKLEPWESDANNFVKKYNSLGGRIFNKDYLILNSIQDGIILCDAKGRILQHINNRKGMQNNTALSSFIDNNRNLWVGLDNGIGFINENSPFTYLGSSFGFSTVYSSVEYGGKLYVATNQGLFCHTWTDPFREESFQSVEGTAGQVWDIQNIDGELFCSHNRGLFLITNGKAGRVLDDRKGYLNLKKVPGRPNLLIASNYHGFSVIEKTSSGWQYRNQIEGFTLSDSKFVTDGANVWLKKNDAFKLTMDSQMRRFNKITTYKTLDKDLREISSIQELGGKIYFQTNNRFYNYDNRADNFTEDKKMSGIFRGLPGIRYCFEDRLGNIFYFFGNSSMGMLQKQKDGTFKDIHAPFSSLTGNLVFYFESVNTINSNNVFIGITDGLVHYNPHFHLDTSVRPKAFIRNFLFAGDTLVTVNMKDPGDIEIPYRSNKVEFTFSSPVYDYPENVRFSYKLEGFDEKWSKWSSVPSKEYTFLHEGDYCMQVKVMDSYGSVSDIAGVKFTVLPPFYRHPLAYAGYVILAIVAIWYGRRRIKTKITRNRYLAELEQQKIYLEKETRIRQEQLELEKEIERLKNEQLQVKIQKQDRELVKNSLQVVKKDKVLNNIANKIKDIDATPDESARARLTKLSKTIDKELKPDKSWGDLEKHIRNVHFEFLKRLKDLYPAITPREMDLATYLLMNMSSKEIAEMMNISEGGAELARHRLRKKLGLSRKENLITFLMGI